MQGIRGATHGCRAGIARTAAGQHQGLFAVLGGHCLLLAFTWPGGRLSLLLVTTPAFIRWGSQPLVATSRGQVTQGHSGGTVGHAGIPLHLLVS